MTLIIVPSTVLFNTPFGVVCTLHFSQCRIVVFVCKLRIYCVMYNSIKVYTYNFVYLNNENFMNAIVIFNIPLNNSGVN